MREGVPRGARRRRVVPRRAGLPRARGGAAAPRLGARPRARARRRGRSGLVAEPPAHIPRGRRSARSGSRRAPGRRERWRPDSGKCCGRLRRGGGPPTGGSAPRSHTSATSAPSCCSSWCLPGGTVAIPCRCCVRSAPRSSRRWRRCGPPTAGPAPTRSTCGGTSRRPPSCASSTARCAAPSATPARAVAGLSSLDLTSGHPSGRVPRAHLPDHRNRRRPVGSRRSPPRAVRAAASRRRAPRRRRRPSPSPSLQGTITVLAASSLTNGFTQLGKEFEAAHPGTSVKFSFGSSSMLVTQIENGAPADAFASADESNMTKVVQANDASGDARRLREEQARDRRRARQPEAHCKPCGPHEVGCRRRALRSLGTLRQVR